MATNFQALFFRSITVLLFYFSNLPSFGQDTTLLNTNKKTVIRYFDEVVNTKKLDRMGEFFSQDYIWHQMNGIDVRSSQDSSHISTIRGLFTAMPDAHYSIDHVIAEGDMVALNTTLTGTGTEKSETGQKKVRVKQMFFFRIKKNKIAEEWEVVDVDGLKAQLAK